MVPGALAQVIVGQVLRAATAPHGQDYTVLLALLRSSCFFLTAHCKAVRLYKSLTGRTLPIFIHPGAAFCKTSRDLVERISGETANGQNFCRHPVSLRAWCSQPRSSWE